MPPRAISRSNTYLPKICGNMRARHLSATFALLVLQSCSSPPPAETQRIVAHYAPLCTPASDHSGSRTIEIRALGDFESQQHHGCFP